MAPAKSARGSGALARAGRPSVGASVGPRPRVGRGAGRTGAGTCSRSAPSSWLVARSRPSYSAGAAGPRARQSSRRARFLGLALRIVFLQDIGT
eukprot:scaffold3905_cov390-Prasinococcus_capsulatus_cf.AAC.1